MTTTAVDARSAGEAAAVPRAAGAAAVPCLSSNNSDTYSGKLTGLDRKRAETVRQNVALLAETHGPNLGFLTITFPEDLDTRTAQKKLANFRRRVLKEHFGETMTVREFTKRGRPHFHILIDCLGDITTGYNWEHHDAVTLWSKNGCKGAKPRGTLNRTDVLAKLHELLRERGPNYGLGRMELVPIRKADAIGFYVGGYLSKSLGNKPPESKGTRSVNYSHKCRRRVVGAFSWNNVAGQLWRLKAAKWGAMRGIYRIEDVPRCLSRWAYHCREEIMGMELDYWPTAEHARRDGAFKNWELQKMGPDAIEIHRESVPLRGSSTIPGGVKPNILRRFLDPRSFLHLAFRDWGSEVRVEEGWYFAFIPSLHVSTWNVKSGPCDSSQAPRGVPIAQPEAMFPLEEGFEGKRGAPLQAAPVGDSLNLDRWQKEEYAWEIGKNGRLKVKSVLSGQNPF